MKDIQELLTAPGLEATAFPPSSRYHGIATATRETVHAVKQVYLRRRFVPPPERFALLQFHEVEQADRLDNLAAHYVGDPEQYWRVCDANGAMRPNELVETVGRELRITLPEGIPGDTRA
jgi:hypothetical protein